MNLTWAEYSRNKILPLGALEVKISELRRQNKSIATLNGSFDLLHAGHLYMIFEASKKADILIIGVNSDASVKAYKSPKRPIIPLAHRMEMLTALEFVDYVTWFEEENPCVLLEKIKPDVHVNGIEYGENCIEAEIVKKHGGKLHLVDRIPGLATSFIIEAIKELMTCA